MPTQNLVSIMGNLTRDPELRFTTAGTPVVNFGFAINETYRDQNGQRIESPVFVEIEVWKREAELVNQYAKKGDPVHIQGSLKFESWRTPEGKRSRLKVRAHRVQFLKPSEASMEDNRESYAEIVEGSKNGNGHNGNQTRRNPTPQEAPPVPSPPPNSDDDIPF